MSPERESSEDAPSIRVFFGDLRKMTAKEIADGEVSLIVTSPPYYNAPFDYPGLFPTYDDYLALIRSFVWSRSASQILRMALNSSRPGPAIRAPWLGSIPSP